MKLEPLLSILEEPGIRGEKRLKLIIHDGGSGLCSALRTVYFGAEEQRCLFHKLRNLYRAIQVPDRLSAKQKRRRRKAIFKDFHAIWQARRYDTVLRRYLKVVRAYRHAQPEAVATLRRDFRATVTYYQLEQQFPTWERKHTCAPPAAFNASTVESVADLVRPVPTTRTKAFAPWSPWKPINSMPHRAMSNFHRI